jgi:hypothetical protein
MDSIDNNNKKMSVFGSGESERKLKIHKSPNSQGRRTRKVKQNSLHDRLFLTRSGLTNNPFSSPSVPLPMQPISPFSDLCQPRL